MAEVFEEQNEEKEIKKKKETKPEIKAPVIKGPEAIKTLMEIHEIRETARKGREIIARKKGDQIEPKEEEFNEVKHKDVDIKSMLEPPTPPEAGKTSSKKIASGKLEPLSLFTSKSQSQVTEKIGSESETVKKRKSKFDEMMRKMKKFIE